MKSAAPALEVLDMHEKSARDEAGLAASIETLEKLSKAFEMEFVPDRDGGAVTSTWSMGQTLWFSVLASAALWAAIIGAIWLI
jgi:hypothetical protein